MRVLFYTLAGSGHFHPTVPLAQGLKAAGHEVAFAVAASFRPAVERTGFRTFAAGIDFSQIFGSPEAMRQAQERMKASGGMDPARAVEMFVMGFTRSAVPDLLRTAADFRPQLLVGESVDSAVPLVGEKLGLPYATVQVGGGNFVVTAPEALREKLEPLRRELSLPADPALSAFSRYLHLAFVAPRYFGGVAMPATAHYFRADVFDQSGEEGLPPWVAQLPERPLVYATLGTAFNKGLEPLEVIAEGLKDEPLNLVITVGRDQDPARLRTSGKNVHVERYIPQTLLYPKCALAILHGGYGSVTSALRHGLPMLIVPQGADQPLNAARAHELGAAEVLHPDELSPEAVRTKVRRLLDQPGFRERAHAYRAEAEALPGMDRAVALVEELAREKEPLMEKREGR